MKGGSSPRDKLLDDKDDLKVDLDSSFSHSHGKHNLLDLKMFFKYFFLGNLDPSPSVEKLSNFFNQLHPQISVVTTVTAPS